MPPDVHSKVHGESSVREQAGQDQGALAEQCQANQSLRAVIFIVNCSSWWLAGKFPVISFHGELKLFHG